MKSTVYLHQFVDISLPRKIRTVSSADAVSLWAYLTCWPGVLAFSSPSANGHPVSDCLSTSAVGASLIRRSRGYSTHTSHGRSSCACGSWVSGFDRNAPDYAAIGGGR